MTVPMTTAAVLGLVFVFRRAFLASGVPANLRHAKCVKNACDRRQGCCFAALRHRVRGAPTGRRRGILAEVQHGSGLHVAHLLHHGAHGH